MSTPVVIKHGISCEAKVADIPVSEHLFWVVSHGGAEYRIDVGVMASNAAKKRVFSVRKGSEILCKGTGYKKAQEVVELMGGVIAGTQKVGNIRIFVK